MGVSFGLPRRLLSGVVVVKSSSCFLGVVLIARPVAGECHEFGQGFETDVAVLVKVATAPRSSFVISISTLLPRNFCLSSEGAEDKVPTISSPPVGSLNIGSHVVCRVRTTRRPAFAVGCQYGCALAFAKELTLADLHSFVS